MVSLAVCSWCGMSFDYQITPVLLEGKAVDVKNYRFMVMACNSFLITCVNILIIYFVASMMFKLKEVAPYGSKARFWSQDLKYSRHFNRILNDKKSDQAEVALLKEMAPELRAVDPELNKMIHEAEQRRSQLNAEDRPLDKFGHEQSLGSPKGLLDILAGNDPYRSGTMTRQSAMRRLPSFLIEDDDDTDAGSYGTRGKAHVIGDLDTPRGTKNTKMVTSGGKTRLSTISEGYRPSVSASDVTNESPSSPTMRTTGIVSDSYLAMDDGDYHAMGRIQKDDSTTNLDHHAIEMDGSVTLGDGLSSPISSSYQSLAEDTRSNESQGQPVLRKRHCHGQRSIEKKGNGPRVPPHDNVSSSAYSQLRRQASLQHASDFLDKMNLRE